MPHKPSAKPSEHAVSDQAAAYIADALMQLALQFEATHMAQIRRHRQSTLPTHHDDPRQLDLFNKQSIRKSRPATNKDVARTA